MLQSVSERCDQWCLSHHRNGRCPSQYDAMDNAASKHFHRLKELIEAIRDGRRKPGDGLTDFMAHAAFTPQPPSEKKTKTDKVRIDCFWPLKQKSFIQHPVSHKDLSITPSVTKILVLSGCSKKHSCSVVVLTNSCTHVYNHVKFKRQRFR